MASACQTLFNLAPFDVLVLVLVFKFYVYDWIFVEITLPYHWAASLKREKGPRADDGGRKRQN